MRIELGRLTAPAAVPVIQTGEPSPEEIDNWSEPVAVTSAAPITTLFEPVVMLSAA